MTNQTTNSQKNVYFIPLAVIIAGIIIAGAVIFTSEDKNVSEEIQVAEILPSDDSNSQPQPVEPEEIAQPKFTITKEDHVRGNFDALITIVEFSDFQCPFCAKFHPTMQQILNDYSNQVRWVYKHFPLDSIHSEARPSAEASECVFEQKGDQGFWQFADGLFENQSQLGSNLYNELASQTGLNLDQFKSCVSSRKYKDKVEADYQEGIRAGVTGTPGSFVNGEIIPGAVPYDYLKSAVEGALSNLQ